MPTTKRKPSYACIITSKLRSDDVKTLKTLGSSVPSSILVEPNEVKAYGNHKRVLALPENEKGLGYARWYAQDYATRKLKCDVLWLLDDDITGILVRSGVSDKGYAKLKPLSSKGIKNAFEEMSQVIVDKGITQLGLSFIASNWMHPGTYKYYTRCTQVFALNIPLLAQRVMYFSPKQVLYSDYDFTLLQLTRGSVTARTYQYAFDTVLMNSNEGGCKVFRSKAYTSLMCDRLIRSYGYSVVSKFWSVSHRIYEPRIRWSKAKDSYSKKLSGRIG